jgi:hypothetical protein
MPTFISAGLRPGQDEFLESLKNVLEKGTSERFGSRILTALGETTFHSRASKYQENSTLARRGMDGVIHLDSSVENRQYRCTTLGQWYPVKVTWREYAYRSNPRGPT